MKARGFLDWSAIDKDSGQRGQDVGHDVGDGCWRHNKLITRLSNTFK